MNKVIDCNYCNYLNISEREQNKLKGEPHICLKFGKQVFHYVNTKEHASYLYPCSECVCSEYVSFSRVTNQNESEES